MRILLIEDDKKIASFIKKGLEEESYAVDVFYNGEDGLFWALENEYDSIILDLMLPGKDGITILKTIRKKKIITPVLLLTSKDSIEDKVIGLDEGADDYLTKPFSFNELLARLRSLFRRSQDYKTKTLKIADLELNPVTRKLTRAGKNIVLSGKEYALLEYLMRNKGKVVSETLIVEHVWDMNFDSFTNVVNVYIHHLRKKIDMDHEIKLIHTIRGAGYIIKEEMDENI